MMISRSNTFLEIGACSFAGLLLMVLPAMVVVAASPETWEDRDRFPEAYSILTSDRLMFPDDVSDWSLKIDSKHQLFVDDYVISEIEQLTRTFHQPVKHPGNPLMVGHPTVLFDDAQGLFRMWNRGQHFTSADGVHWDKTDLGPEGDSQPQIVMYNPDVPEEEGRYKAIRIRKSRREGEEPSGRYAFLYHSRDGLHWERRPEYPVLRQTVNHMMPSEFRPNGAGKGRPTQRQNPDHIHSDAMGDTTTFRYDPVLKRYIYDGKFKLYFPKDKFKQLGIVPEKIKPFIRLRTFSESEDMIHWSQPRIMMFPDRLDPPDRQFYEHEGFAYESMWMGIVRTMQIQPVGWKQTDMQLTYSRDGRHWSRPRHREPFIPLGDPDGWEPDYSGPSATAPILFGEELYFYYFGSRHFTRDKISFKDFRTYVGLAKLRRDGFASLDAGNTPGQLITRPLQFQGKTLFVNAVVEKDGWVKSAILSRNSQPISEYALEDSMPLTKDTTQGQMTWNAKANIALSGDDHLRIQFQLKNAKLYSFWIE